VRSLLLPPRLFGEATVYKLGLVIVFIVAACGLHVLVNWVGELSLAQAGLIGVPAFILAKLSSEHDLNPLLLLPVALLTGAIVGALIGLPSLRVRGLYVAIVTLAAGIAIDSFFFTRSWLVGAGAVTIDAPLAIRPPVLDEPPALPGDSDHLRGCHRRAQCAQPFEAGACLAMDQGRS